MFLTKRLLKKFKIYENSVRVILLRACLVKNTKIKLLFKYRLGLRTAVKVESSLFDKVIQL